MRIWLFVMIFWVLTGCASQKETPPEAQAGRLDLTRWNFEQQGLAALNGEWEFYWQQLLQPDDFHAHPPKTAGARVPGRWFAYRLDGQALPGNGYATFRLFARLVPTDQVYGLRITGIDTAYRIWMNGQEILADGVVGATRQTSEPHNTRRHAFFTLSSVGVTSGTERQPATLELVIQNSNFQSRSGGIWSAVYFGLATDIARSQARANALDLFQFGSLFATSLYHFGLYSLRRKDRHTLYLGVLCLLTAIRTVVMGESFLGAFLPGLSWSALLKIEYITFYLGTPTLLAFLFHLYPEDYAGWFSRALQMLGGIFSGFVALAPPHLFTQTLPYFQAVTIITAAYSIYGIIHAIRRRRKCAMLIGIGQLVMLCAAVNDVLYANGLIDTGYLISFGVMLFVMMQSFALSARFANAFSAVEALSDQLREEIAERQHAEASIRESEERYRQLVELLPDGIFVHQAGRLIYANHALARLLNADDPSALLGRSVSSLVHPTHHASVMEQIQQHQRAQNAAPFAEGQFIRLDGAAIDVEVAAAAYPSHGAWASLVIARDITERKRIEAKLEASHKSLEASVKLRTAELAAANVQLKEEISERRLVENALAEERNLLRILFDHLPDVIFIKDTALRFLESNVATALAMGAASPENLFGKTDFDFYPLEFAQQYAARERAIFETGEPMLNIEEFHLDPTTGEPKWFLSTKIPFNDQHGVARGLVGIGHDITNRKRTEEALHQAHAELKQAVAEELRQRRIAESLREIAMMLNSSLDLKTVLEKIMAQLQRVVQYDSAAILLHEGGHLVVYSGLNIPESAKGKAISFKSQDPAICVFQQKIPLWFADVSTDPHWQTWPETEQIRSWIGVPLLANDTVLGVLTVDRFTVDAYHAEDARVLHIFANQAALAIYNARRFEIETRLRREAETLRAATQALSTTLNLQQVFELILSELRKVVPYDSASVQQLQGTFLEIIGGDGFPNLPEVLGLRFDVTATDNPNHEVIRTRAPVIIDDVQSLYAIFRSGPHAKAYIHSWLGVPLLFGDHLLGMISLDQKKPGFYTQEHANLALAFASQAALAIRNAQLYQAMKREKQFFETLMLNSPVATVMTDPTGAISLWNPSAERLFGYARDEAVGHHLDDIITSPAMREEEMAYTSQAFDGGGTVRAMTRRSRKDGAFVEVELFAVPVTVEQKHVAVLALYHDITELKQAEAKLIAANNELHETLEHLQRTQTQLIHAEKMAALGKLVASIAHEINTPLGAIRASVENISKTIKQTLEGLPTFLSELSAERCQDFWTLFHRALQKDLHISAKEERKIKREVAKELQSFHLDSSQKIAELLVNLGIYANLSDLMPLLNDPRHPMILDMAYRLSGLYESAETIFLSTERASKVVFALKTYAQYDHSGQRAMANVLDGIEAVLTLYHAYLNQGITVGRQYGDVPPICCYPDELNQVWTNLIHNAVQAMQGKGRLDILVNPVETHDHVETHGRASLQPGILVEITDSGPGIPDAIKRHIFEPFFTTKPMGEGSGLGLDICQKIIEKHRGTIDCDSQPGRTTFRVWLPA